MVTREYLTYFQQVDLVYYGKNQLVKQTVTP